MNSLLFIRISLLITFFSTPILGMLTEQTSIIDNMLMHPDIRRYFRPLVHKKDRADMRLVCKQWAAKNINWQTRPNWKCIPDNLERKYDKKRTQKYRWKSVDTTLILFDCASEDDLESIQWLIDNISLKCTSISFKSGINPESPFQCSLSPSMIAIHKKNPEIARFLIQSEHHSKNRSWKKYYDETVVPQYIKQFLYTGHTRDFSFLLYLNATWSDNVENLKQLYKQKIPTEIGQKCLIYECLYENAIQCFTFLLTHKNIKKIIRNNCIEHFKRAVNTHRKEIPQKLLKEKLFYLNETLEGENKTILDYYYEIKDGAAIALLLDLGARKYNT
jgi:hypothetical protein